jgi:hypothetical protein
MVNVRFLLYGLAAVTGTAILTFSLLAAPASPGSDEREAPQFVTVTYNVADLVIPVEPIRGQASPSQTLEGMLMETLRYAVAPESWTGLGGKATIHYYPLGMALVVSQTAENQEKIASLLTELRKNADKEVALEMRQVTVTCAVGEQFRNLAGFQPIKSFEGAILNERQVHAWLDYVQGDRGTCTCQAPKITLFNGQHAYINVGDEITTIDGADKQFIGMRSEFLPVITANGKFVRLPFSYLQREKICAGELEQTRTLALEHTVTIADGKTFACYLGCTKAYCKREAKIPVVSDLPIVGEFFKATVGAGLEDRDVFILITPRIIINEEQERTYLGELVSPAIPK